MLQRVELRTRQHLLDPDDVAAFLVELGERGLDLLGDLRGVRGAGAQHHLNVLGDQVQRLEQVWQALLTGDAADEQQRRLAAVDVVTVEHGPARVVVGRRGEVAHGDAVMHHDDLVGVEVRVRGEDVLAHAAGDGDDAVGVLVGVLFGPGAQIITAAELLALPRAERLQRMRGDDQRRTVQHLGEVSGQARIPGVRVGDVGVDVVGYLQINAEGLQRRIRVGQLRGRSVAHDLQAALRRAISGDGGYIGFGARSVERTDGHVDPLGQHLRELFRVHACATIDIRRVFAGEDINFHD